MTKETFTFTLAGLKAHCKQAYNAGFARGFDKGKEIGRRQGSHTTWTETMRANGYTICGDHAERYDLCQYEDGSCACIHCNSIAKLPQAEED